MHTYTNSIHILSKVERCIHSAFVLSRVFILHSIKTNYPKLGIFFGIYHVDPRRPQLPFARIFSFGLHEHASPIQVFNSCPSIMYLVIVSMFRAFVIVSTFPFAIVSTELHDYHWVDKSQIQTMLIANPLGCYYIVCKCSISALF